MTAGAGGEPATRSAADLAAELTTSIRSMLEPLSQEIDESRRQRDSDAAYLAGKRERGMDEETRQVFDEAARSPQAPESMRRLAEKVADGSLTWDQVFRGQGGEDGLAFREAALATAAEHADSFALTPVEVPDEAREDGADPDLVTEEADRDRAEAKAAHDRVWAEEFLR